MSELLEPPPFSYGIVIIDIGQLELRWKLFDVLGSAVTLASIDIRGPTTHTEPYVGPVALALGLQQTHGKFAGVEDVSAKLLYDMLDKPYAYYVSFADDTGREVIRDALTKTCYSNL